MKRRNLFNLAKGLTFVIILALGVLPSGLAAAEETTTVSVSAPSEIDPGEQFTVSIAVEPGTAIAGVQFDLSFNHSLVTANSVAEGTLLSQDGATTYFNAGTIDNMAGNVNAVAGAIITPGQTVSTIGTFATITLTAGTAAGTCPLTLSGVVVGDANGQSVPVSVVSGQVTVNDQDTTNQPPILNPIGNKSIKEDTLLQFTISATDPNEDTLTYSASNLPSGATFNTQTRVFSWTPNSTQIGAHTNVQFEVSDGELTDSENITITVLSIDNNAPVLDTIGNSSINETELLEFTVSATDPEDDPLTFSASNLPSGATFNTQTRVFSWTPSFGQEGIYSNIHFEVSDGILTDSEEITITVNIPTPPGGGGSSGVGDDNPGGGGSSGVGPDETQPVVQNEAKSTGVTKVVSWATLGQIIGGALLLGLLTVLLVLHRRRDMLRARNPWEISD